MKRIIFYMLMVLMSMATLTACGILPQSATNSARLENVLPPTKPAGPADQTIAPIRKQVHDLLKAQDYPGAITLLRDATHQGIDEQLLAKEYLQAVNGSLKQAENLMTQGDYSGAALLFKTIRDNSPGSPALRQEIAISPAQLAEKIAFCTEKLMDAGLVAYRCGDFAAAIDIWQQVLTFNPQHQAAQQSIQTTQLQVANLKSLEHKN